jgi:hypothetical protein
MRRTENENETNEVVSLFKAKRGQSYQYWKEDCQPYDE